MGIHRGSGPLGSGPTGPGSGFSVMPFFSVLLLTNHKQRSTNAKKIIFPLIVLRT